MRDKIDKILGEVIKKEKSECNAIDELCDLLRVEPRFSVSLVYVKHTSTGLKIILRCLITDASSEDEALGKAIMESDKEKMEGFNLNCKAVLPVFK